MPDVLPVVTLLKGLAGSLDATAIAEVLWLAAHRAAGEGGTAVPATTAGPAVHPSPDAPGVTQKPPGPAAARRPRADGQVPAAHDVVVGTAHPEGARVGHPISPASTRSRISRPLAESMRSLKTKWRNGRAPQLDLDRTIEQYAVTRVLVPLTKPVPERWFEVDLVVDSSGAGPVWREEIEAFAGLLRDLGAFRAIRRWTLAYEAGAPRLVDRAGRRRTIDSVRSSDHRRLIFVASDFTGQIWHRAQAWDAVRLWAESSATVLVELLPPKLRHITAVYGPTITARPGLPGSPNTGLVVRRQGIGNRVLPMPLLTLTPVSLRRWADMLMRGDPAGCPTILLLPERPPFTNLVTAQRKAADALDGVRLVELFELTASHNARRVATLSAALSDVNLAVLRLIARRMVPAATVSDIAEVVVSNLYRRAQADGVLRFRPGVREALQQRLMRPDVWRVFAALKRYAAEGAAPERFFEQPAVLPFIEALNEEPLNVGAPTASRPRDAVRVADADPHQLGLHRSAPDDTTGAGLPPYVTRDVDKALRTHIVNASRVGGLVLVVGGIATGKTRSLYEMVRSALPDWWLFHPAGWDALTAFADMPAPRTVVWLDDLEYYLELRRGLAARVVQALADDGTLIVGTLRLGPFHARNDLPGMGTPDAFAAERALLRAASVSQLPYALSDFERTTATRLATADERIRIALRSDQVGFTQNLAAGPEIVRQWRNASLPYDKAVITAALDARRAGARATLTTTLLREAAAAYLTGEELAIAPAGWFERALFAASVPPVGHTGCLSTVFNAEGRVDGYLVADYLHQVASVERAFIALPDAMWQALVNHHAPEDAVRLADTARRMNAVRYERLLRPSTSDAAVIRLTGSIDMESEAAIRERLDPLLDRPYPRIVVDVSGLDFCDSMGLGALVSAHKTALQRGGWVRLAGNSRFMRRLLDTLGLTDYLTLHPDVDSAVNA